MAGIKNVFGGATLDPGKGFGDANSFRELFETLERGDCHIIDTANIYGDSEKIIGEAKAGERFTIDTKTRGGFTKLGGARNNILAEAKQSKDFLKTNVDIYYMHCPDVNVDMEESAAAINEIYKQGFFKRFGLSNFKAEEVEKMYEVCKKNNYVLPTVYQGNYSAVARKQETLLFPTLRKLGIAFYAYSPLAGGFLTKTKAQIEEGAGRFKKGTFLGDMYLQMYAKPSYFKALEEWEKIADEEGCSRAQLAYRWVKYNSPLKPEYGDAIIVGARSRDQLEQTLEGLKDGPLSQKAVARIDEVWESIKHEAPLDNFDGMPRT